MVDNGCVKEVSGGVRAMYLVVQIVLMVVVARQVPVILLLFKGTESVEPGRL